MITDEPLPPDQPPGPGASDRAAAPGTARGPWRTARRWTRAVLLGAVLGIALLGAVVTPLPGMLLFAPLFGVLLAGTLALVDSDFPRETSSRRGVVYAAVVGVLLVPFANGLVGLGALGGAVLLGLVILGPLLVADRAASPADAATGAAPAAPREPLAELTTEQLLEEWRASEELLADPAHRATATEVRARLLDELSRRDPAGVAAWLAAGGRCPDSHIRADRDLAG